MLVRVSGDFAEGNDRGAGRTARRGAGRGGSPVLTVMSPTSTPASRKNSLDLAFLADLRNSFGLSRDQVALI